MLRANSNLLIPIMTQNAALQWGDSLIIAPQKCLNHYFVMFCLHYFHEYQRIDPKSFVKNFSPVSITEELIEDDMGHKTNTALVEFTTKPEAFRFLKEIKQRFEIKYAPQVLANNKGVLICIWHDREKIVQKLLCSLLGGKKEVRTPAGRIDLLTETQIIEIKTFKRWKEAIGQIVVYGSFYPSHQKIVYLFDKEKPRLLEAVTSACLKQGIIVEFYLDEGWSYGD